MFHALSDLFCQANSLTLTFVRGTLDKRLERTQCATLIVEVDSEQVVYFRQDHHARRPSSLLLLHINVLVPLLYQLVCLGIVIVRHA
jgi:hypothetical protein